MTDKSPPPVSKKSILEITAVVAVITAAIGAEFFSNPPILWPEAGKISIAHLARVCIIGLVALLVSRSRSRQISPIYTYIVLGIGLIFALSYVVAISIFSCPFAGSRIATGWTYLHDAAEYIARNPNRSCSLLLGDHLGEVREIWPVSQIIFSWSIINILYLIALSALSAVVVRAAIHWNQAGAASPSTTSRGS